MHFEIKDYSKHRYTVYEYHADMKTVKEVRKYKMRSMSHRHYGTIFFGCGTGLPDKKYLTLESGKWEYYNENGTLIKTERKNERKRDFRYRKRSKR